MLQNLQNVVNRRSKELKTIMVLVVSLSLKCPYLYFLFVSFPQKINRHSEKNCEILDNTIVKWE